MNMWANAVITNKGLALQSKLIEGTTLNITRAVTGTGFVTPGLLQAQTEVSGEAQTLTFKKISYPEEGKSVVPMYLTNEGIDTGYTARQVGIYANDPDEGEILYFIAQAESGEGTIVPSETEMPGYNAEWTFYFKYGNADGISVSVDPAHTVSRSDMEEFFEESFVPITSAEIDVLIGWSGGDVGGDTGEDIGGGATGTYTLDHSMLYNRNIADQHTIDSITGLEEALTAAEGSDIDTLDIAAAWDEATTESE